VPRTPLRRRLLGLRASTYFLVAVTAAAAAGGLYLHLRDGTETVYAAAADIPAFHQVTQMDVRATEVRSSAVPPGAKRSRSDVLGRYTLEKVGQDDPFREAGLGPRLPERTIDGQRVVGVSAVAREVDGVVGRGDRIDLVFSPRVAAQARPVTLSNALLLDVRRAGNHDYVGLICLVPQENADLLQSAAGDPRLFVTRREPYGGG
jgi:hypothetical protein